MVMHAQRKIVYISSKILIILSSPIGTSIYSSYFKAELLRLDDAVAV